MNDEKKEINPLEDTDRIQKAIEAVVDHETATLPLLPDLNLDDDAGEEDIRKVPVDSPRGRISEHHQDEVEESDDMQPKDIAEPAEKTSLTTKPNENAAGSMADAPVHSWFFTFMCMNIPVIGWFYLLYLAFNKKKALRRNFARAYLYYKLLFLLISAVILGILIYIGMGLLDQLLAYMEML